MSDPQQTEVVVGRVRRAMGLRGEVMVDVITDEPDLRFAPGAHLHSESGVQWVIDSLRWQSGRLVVRFAGIDDRTAAEALAGTVLWVWVSAAEFPEDPDEYYDRHLVGVRVRRADGAEVGFISEVVHGGAQDLLSVDIDGSTHLVPFVTQLVPVVDLAAGYVVVADLPGLLDDLDPEESQPSPRER